VIVKTINPRQFFALVAAVRAIDDEMFSTLASQAVLLSPLVEAYAREHDELVSLGNAYVDEINRTLRSRVRDTDPLEMHSEALRDFQSSLGDNFVKLAIGISEATLQQFRLVHRVLAPIRRPDLLLSCDTLDLDKIDVQKLAFEIDINMPEISHFVASVMAASTLRRDICDTVASISRAMDRYYQALLKRHTVDGIEVHGDPVRTDVARLLFENIDGHGEIASGTKPDELSAYSLEKARILAEAVRTGIVRTLIEKPSALVQRVREKVEAIWAIVERVDEALRPLIETVHAIVSPYDTLCTPPTRSRVERELHHLDTVDPCAIRHREPTMLLSPEERFRLKFDNETLATLVKNLDWGASAQGIVQFVLERKAMLRRRMIEENSFYVCRIGTGNPFRGDAPGGLEVVPGTRPVVVMDEILGSGFDEIRDFLAQVGSTAEWNDLFVATSPSRTADKSNVLLVGPQGSGKTEILRAVGGDRGSIGIFAQASDFLTCWLGEAQKNPKRMFEAGLKLQRDSGRHVHFLIDEIDAVLNSDQTDTRINLTLEFQVLMDGVVHYPNLSVWGTTNHPERIPMPMIRRFSKVVIVGELKQEDRVRLLRHFVEFMPTRGFDDGAWECLAERLEGATGDVVRKVVDPVWRMKMHEMIGEHPDEAKALVKWLNDGEKFDVGSFSAERRSTFREKLAAHVQVTPLDVEISIAECLDNIAIRHEIATAVETYARARTFLHGLRLQRIDLAHPGNGRDDEARA